MPTKPRRRVDINIQAPFRTRVSRPWLRAAVLRALDVALPTEVCQVGLVIAGDDTLKRLNREYRGVDEITDVLSFSASHQGHWEGPDGAPSQAGDIDPFVLPPGEPAHLGEVIISYPQAERQAVPKHGEEPEAAAERELALLIAHGVLHLLGYDHVEAAEEAGMQSKERQILSGILS